MSLGYLLIIFPYSNHVSRYLIPGRARHAPGRKFRKLETTIGKPSYWIFLRCKSNQVLKLWGAPTYWWNNESLDQLTYVSMNQWTHDSMNQWFTESKNYWRNDSTNLQSMHHWINGPMNQWVYEPMSEWINESVNKRTNEWMDARMDAWENYFSLLRHLVTEQMSSLFAEVPLLSATSLSSPLFGYLFFQLLLWAVPYLDRFCSCLSANSFV